MKIDESHINLSNMTNKFLALQNTQFVENRIQEDHHETVPTENLSPSNSKVSTQYLLINLIGNYKSFDTTMSSNVMFIQHIFRIKKPRFPGWMQLN